MTNKIQAILALVRTFYLNEAEYRELSVILTAHADMVKHMNPLQKILNDLFGKPMTEVINLGVGSLLDKRSPSKNVPYTEKQKDKNFRKEYYEND